jgi:hypothetical protein
VAIVPSGLSLIAPQEEEEEEEEEELQLRFSSLVPKGT